MGGSSQWKVDGQEFPALGTQKTAGKVIGSSDPNDTDMGRQPCGHPIPVARVLDREMRPAKDIRSVPRGNRDVRTRGVQEPLTSPLSPLAESFTPRPTSEEQQNQRQHTDNYLSRSPAMTGLGETETSWDSIKEKIATIGTADPIEIGKPVAMADVAEPRGPAGAGGPVVAGTSLTAVTDRTGASGQWPTKKRDRCTGRDRNTFSDRKRQDRSQWPGRDRSWPSLRYMLQLQTRRVTSGAILETLIRLQKLSRK